MNALTDIKPEWTICDHEADLSDVWDDHDPLTRGEIICTGFFHSFPATWRGINEEGDVLELMGVAVTDDYGTTFHDREWLGNVWGVRELWRLEELATPAWRGE